MGEIDRPRFIEGSLVAWDAKNRLPYEVPESPMTDLEFNIAWLEAPKSVEGEVYIAEGWDSSPKELSEEELEFAPSALPYFEIDSQGELYPIDSMAEPRWIAPDGNGQYRKLTNVEYTSAADIFVG